MNSIKSIFSVDLRSLALMRIGISLVVIYDLITRMGDLAVFYSDGGLLPRSILEQSAKLRANSFSLNMLHGDVWFQAIIFILAIIAATALLTGYKSTIASIMTWLFMVSIQNRNISLSYGVDYLLVIILFWGMFIPWGKRFSIDELKTSPSIESGDQYFSIASVAFMVQIALMYWYSGFAKSAPEWRTDFSAMYYVLSLDQLVYPFGKFIYQFPILMNVLTVTTLIIELVIPFLFFISYRNGLIRTLTVLMLCAFHASVGFSIFLGLFPFVSVILLIGLLPSWFWKKLLRSRSPGTYASLPRPLVYTYVKAGVISIFLLWMVVWNVGDMTRIVIIPRQVEKAGVFLRFEQKWGFFAPKPYTNDGWFMIPATLNDSSVVDLFTNGKPVTNSKPEWISRSFKNHRWANFMFYLDYYDEMHDRYGRYLCENWNGSHSEEQQIKSLEVIYMREETLPDYETKPVEREVILSCKCDAKELIINSKY